MYFPREPDFEYEKTVVLVSGPVVDPDRQIRHVGRGRRWRVDGSRCLPAVVISSCRILSPTLLISSAFERMTFTVSPTSLSVSRNERDAGVLRRFALAEEDLEILRPGSLCLQ